ncbi:MAG: monofunctional biosynthetic peptidoglycan transglycosylase [Xanthomonadales bacterium]|nr:monofunctional biosynthetic peptidoglycan transglycosylase [Xanthomonadales bacterium]ODU91965.1 MAG: monofunctional biosynthetic peptidoglycan transglycosylase [Rhodanobacter sp. SCN 66-43]OJY84979.1 MAG: monofunctional biosynthetic peptidoglycan transglycosylase [Xanthomonadales bacterium 66-474]
MIDRGNPRPRRSRARRWLRRLGWLVAAFVVATWLPVLVLRFVPPLTSAYMVERTVAARWQGEHNFSLHYRWVPFKRIAPVAPLAMVAGEDQTFPFNHGFDIASIRSAIDVAETGGRLRGASTITQQVARNLFLWNGGGFFRKGLEAYFTVLIDVTWPKRRVLEVYANIAELGNGIYGVEAAAQTYFHVPASRLSTHQAALLAAVLPNPRGWHADRPSPYIQRRAAWIEQQMRQLGGVAYVLEKQPPRPAGPDDGRRRR